MTYKPSNRDWKEDFPHENGNYLRTCSRCNETFMGHKRRFICKECIKKPELVPIPKSYLSMIISLITRDIGRLTQNQSSTMLTNGTRSAVIDAEIEKLSEMAVILSEIQGDSNNN